MFAHKPQALFSVFVIIALDILKMRVCVTCDTKNYTNFFLFLIDQVVTLYINTGK